jgi:hypothetical protein
MHDASNHDGGFENERAWMETGWMRRGQPAPFSVQAPNSAPTEPRFTVDWIDQQRETTQRADPAYPAGCAIDVALDAPQACRVELPYPAARCGLWVVLCRVCGFPIALAAAGRADDPRSVRLPCRQH